MITSTLLDSNGHARSGSIMPVFKFVPKIEEEFRVVTVVVDRFEVPVTFVSVEKRLTAFIIAAFPLV